MFDIPLRKPRGVDVEYIKCNIPEFAGLKFRFFYGRTLDGEGTMAWRVYEDSTLLNVFAFHKANRSRVGTIFSRSTHIRDYTKHPEVFTKVTARKLVKAAIKKGITLPDPVVALGVLLDLEGVPSTITNTTKYLKWKNT